MVRSSLVQLFLFLRSRRCPSLGDVISLQLRVERRVDDALAASFSLGSTPRRTTGNRSTSCRCRRRCRLIIKDSQQPLTRGKGSHLGSTATRHIRTKSSTQQSLGQHAAWTGDPQPNRAAVTGQSGQAGWSGRAPADMGHPGTARLPSNAQRAGHGLDGLSTAGMTGLVARPEVYPLASGLPYPSFPYVLVAGAERSQKLNALVLIYNQITSRARLSPPATATFPKPALPPPGR